MATERRIKTLKMRVKSLTASLTHIKLFVDEFDEDTQADEIPVRLESLTKLWEDYSTTQSELESLDENSLEDLIKERTTLEASYYRVKGFLLAHNKSHVNQSSPSPTQSVAHFPMSASQVRLPDVKLPIFDGKLENWLVFHDLYISLVHSSTNLSNIQKFYYLRSSLSLSALQLIQSIPLSADNYTVAWNLLLKHFQNPARLKQTYVDALFDFSALKRESAAELHNLVERFEANVKVLHQLGEPTEHWDILLVRMLSTRLDTTTRRDWEEHSSSKRTVKFKDLIEFIQRRVTVLQSIQTKVVDTPSSAQVRKPTFRSASSHSANQVSPRKCLVCSEHHPLYLCGNFSKLSTEDKEKEVRRHQLCRNCLRRGHQSKDCSSSTNCRKCRGRHHTLLCSSDSTSQATSKHVSPPQQKLTSASPVTDTPINSASALVEAISCASASHQQKTVLLATAMIILVDDNGVEHVGRALLDSGSECCFITERFAQCMKVQRQKIYLPISGIGQSSTQAKQKFSATIRSRVGEYSTAVEMLVLPRVTVDLPATSVDTSSWNFPPGIQLADPSFDSTNPVDIILGAEIFFELFRVPGRIHLGEQLPVLIHIFADASQLAYGACAYVRSTNPGGLVKVALLSSKSRVAPLKRLSIPRLELCGALLAAELYEKIKSSLQLDAKCYFWLDSTVVLCWLNASPATWNTFVANRTSKIQLATPNCSWHHISGLENPADCLSRGLAADTIVDFNLWWHGPQWLQQHQNQWPMAREDTEQPLEAMEEARRSSIAATPSTPEPQFIDQIVERFSNVQRLIRVIAYCLRFLHHCRSAPNNRAKSFLLHVSELIEAEHNIIRLVQQQAFSEEWKQLKKNQPVSSKSRLKWFHPFVSSENLLRIGGRLGSAMQPSSDG
nr:uncharacterized protein LOC115265663 [Aedes albopictus]